MKLKNKKTGEMGIINYFDNQSIVIYPIDENWNAKGDKKYVYHSLAELNAVWEDVPEEPEEYWYIDYDGGILCGESDNSFAEKMMISMGNHFKSLEEAALAIRKLKAWKRLKDKGFRLKMWEWEFIYNDNISGELIIKAHIDDATDSDGKYTKDLDLLFPQEDD